MTRSNSCLGIAALALSFVTSGMCAPMPREGTFDFNFCLAGRSSAIESMGDAAAAGSFENTAAIWSNVPGGPFDGQGSHCVGTWSAVDGTYVDSGYCVTTDADGDRFLMEFKTGPVKGDQIAAGKWTARAGTGKYAGMVAQGDYKTVSRSTPAVAGGFQLCNRNTGTYKLK
jgi:hypothetical protein